MTDDLNKPLLPSRSIPQDGDEMEDVLLTTEACFSVGDEGLFSVVVGPLLPIAMLPNHTWYLLDYSPFVHLSV